jgi:hypothetical protein
MNVKTVLHELRVGSDADEVFEQAAACLAEVGSNEELVPLDSNER